MPAKKRKRNNKKNDKGRHDKGKDKQVDSVVEQDETEAQLVKLAALSMTSSANPQPATDVKANISLSTSQQQQPKYADGKDLTPNEISFLKQAGLFLSTNPQPGPNAGASGSLTASQRKQMQIDVKQMHADVKQLILDAEKQRVAKLRTEISENPAPATESAPNSSPSTDQQKKKATNNLPRSFLDWRIPPWPSEQSGAPSAFGLFRNGLKELHKCSWRHAKSCPWMMSSRKYWKRILQNMFKQADRAALQEKCFMQADVRDIQEAFHRTEIATHLKWPELELEKGAISFDAVVESGAGDFMRYLLYQNRADLATYAADFEAGCTRVTSKISKVTELYTEVFGNRRYGVWNTMKLMQALNDVENVTNILLKRLQKLQKRALDTTSAGPTSTPNENETISRASQTRELVANNFELPVHHEHRSLALTDDERDSTLRQARVVATHMGLDGYRNTRFVAKFLNLMKELRREGLLPSREEESGEGGGGDRDDDDLRWEDVD
ncbi:hypothetical protein N0V83_002709 [Neocucurbitaria cava]|uniref:Uncharacterized protein n=1 Tax=Neocucurbitaria cava TaxID=798079 RepID=A0A9W8YC11_9PLEO|nr:hypothetical protein N0V83_002709 [Neocucurbitaria cava]